MMQTRHLLTLSLLGWYLMLPPAGQRNGLPWPDNTASIAQWTIAESFDTAKACEDELSRHRKRFQKTYHKADRQNLGAEFWAKFYVTAAGEASCIATDDPRLRPSTDDSSANVTKSSTN